jgi:hypothetical protein
MAGYSFLPYAFAGAAGTVFLLSGKRDYNFPVIQINLLCLFLPGQHFDGRQFIYEESFNYRCKRLIGTAFS